MGTLNRAMIWNYNSLKFLNQLVTCPKFSLYDQTCGIKISSTIIKVLCT